MTICFDIIALLKGVDRPRAFGKCEAQWRCAVRQDPSQCSSRIETHAFC